MPELSVMAIGIGLAVVFVVGASTVGLARALVSGDALQERLRTYAVISTPAFRAGGRRRRSRLESLRAALNERLARLASEGLRLQLLQANWRLTVAEFAMIRIGGAAAGFGLGWLLSRSPLSGVGLAVIAYMAPGVYLRWSVNRRQLRFAKQLVDILVLLSGSVRAGVSLLQAMELVAREMEPPASDELGRVLHEVGLGVPLPQALRNMAARLENPDLNLVVTAIDIQYQVGGRMATMLTAVTEKIRQRNRLFGEVRVLTTTQRYTGYLLSVLPIFIGGMMFMMNPDYMKRLFDPGPIRLVPIAVGIGIILGHIAMKRIARIEV